MLSYIYHQEKKTQSYPSVYFEYFDWPAKSSTNTKLVRVQKRLRTADR